MILCAAGGLRDSNVAEMAQSCPFACVRALSSQVTLDL